MIQRPQSIFLSITALATVTAALVPLWANIDAGTGQGCMISLWPWQAVSLQGSFNHVFPAVYVSIVAISAAPTAIYAILQYHDRKLQLRLGTTNIGMLGYTIAKVCLLIIAHRSGSLIDTLGQCQPGIWLLFIALFSNLTANHYISKDEKLVQDSERMR